MSTEKIEIRSEKVKEILGHIPHWIVRWGITLLFSILILLLILSWFFKYPDVIPSPIIVTTENPPAKAVARTSGRIENIFVEDKQVVKQGDLLAIIENPANFDHVFLLSGMLDSIKMYFTTFDVSNFFQLENYYSLGEIQISYAGFIKLYNDYRDFVNLNYHQRKIGSLTKETEKHIVHIKQLSNQKGILNEQLEITRQQFLRDSQLFIENALAPADYDKSRNYLLEKQYSVEQAGIRLYNTQIELSKLEQNILELELSYIDEKQQRQTALIEAFDKLTSQIDQWKQKYLLQASIDGIVSFTKFWSKNQYVNNEETVMSVIPGNPGRLLGKMNLPILRSGKVKPGQIVNIKFDNFPHLEYGMVQGIVRSISLVPNEKFYVVEVDLPKGLTTFYDRVLEFSQEMQGTGEIITEDLRLLERIIYPVKYLFEKNIK